MVCPSGADATSGITFGWPAVAWTGTGAEDGVADEGGMKNVVLIALRSRSAISYEKPQTCLEKETHSSSMTTSITGFPFRDMFEGSHS